MSFGDFFLEHIYLDAQNLLTGGMASPVKPVPLIHYDDLILTSNHNDH